MSTQTSITLSTKFKLFFPTETKKEAFGDTIQQGRKIYDRHLHECRKNGDVNKTDLHGRLYEQCKEDYDIQAGMLQTILV